MYELIMICMWFLRELYVRADICLWFQRVLFVRADICLWFQRELFVKAVSSGSIRLFLEWFTQTQMFEVFITSKLTDDASFGECECHYIKHY